MSIIRTHHLSRHYQIGNTNRQVLADIDLTLEAGEFVGLVGPSGCGKTTLLNLCGLIDRPDGGEIYWQTRSLTTSRLAELTELRRRCIGFVFQEFHLIPVMTAWDNIAYPLMLLGLSPSAQRQRVRELANAVGIEPWLQHKPRALSGGQRQRVAIARALAKRPELIIADEPTAALDEDTALGVIELLRTLCRQSGTAVLVATHDVRLSQWCDRLLRLRQGRLVVDSGLCGTRPLASEVTL